MSQPRPRVSVHHLLAFELVLVAAAFAPTLAHAAPGDLDPSFGNGGKVMMKLTSGAGQFGSVAIDSRGRIAAAGGPWGDEHTRAHFVFARYRSNGSLDPSFGDGGIADTDVPGELSSMAIDLRGRIVAAGCTGGDFEVARFHSDGTPDDPFGHGGVVTTDFGGPDCARSVAIDSRGRIVAVGQRGSGNRYGDGGWFVLARYRSNGALDDSFSGDGKAITGFRGSPSFAFGARATSGVIDPKNRIVAAGSIRSSEYPYDRDFALVRFSANGIRTTRSFGARGEVTTDFGAEDAANSIAIDSRGQIVAAGLTYTTVPYIDSFALARYQPDGSLDRTFDGDGKVVTGLGTAHDVAIDSRGRTVAVGETRYENVCGPNQCGPKFAVTRYLPDGGLDPAFGGDGTVITDFGIGGRPSSVAIDLQDRIVVAGADGNSYLLARYLGQ
jgi:uncharacterized delta-60 repeat protein